MRLSEAITKAKSVTELRDVFANDVNIELGRITDAVTVKGYEGSVTTDFIARKVSGSFFRAEKEEGSKELAVSLAKKVFTPLRSLVESRQNRCSFYQVAALTRIGWTPPPAPEFGDCTALKHAMILGCLDDKYKNGW